MVLFILSAMIWNIPRGQQQPLNPCSARRSFFPITQAVTLYGKKKSNKSTTRNSIKLSSTTLFFIASLLQCLHACVGIV